MGPSPLIVLLSSGSGKLLEVLAMFSAAPWDSTTPQLCNPHRRFTRDQGERASLISAQFAFAQPAITSLRGNSTLPEGGINIPLSPRVGEN